MSMSVTGHFLFIAAVTAFAATGCAVPIGDPSPQALDTSQGSELTQALAVAAPVNSTQGACGTSTSGGTASCFAMPAGSIVGGPGGVVYSGNNAGSCVSNFRVSHGGRTAFLGDGITSCAVGGGLCTTTADCPSGTTCANNGAENRCTTVGTGPLPTTTSQFDNQDTSGTWTIDSINNCNFNCNAGGSVQFFVYYRAPAALAVSTTSLLFGSVPINVVPAPQQFSVQNAGQQAMTWSITSSDSSVHVSPASGSNLAPGAATTVTVSPPALAIATTKSATLTVSAGTAGTKSVGITYSANNPAPPPPSLPLSWGLNQTLRFTGTSETTGAEGSWTAVTGAAGTFDRGPFGALTTLSFAGSWDYSTGPSWMKLDLRFVVDGVAQAPQRIQVRGPISVASQVSLSPGGHWVSIETRSVLAQGPPISVSLLGAPAVLGAQ